MNSSGPLKQAGWVSGLPAFRDAAPRVVCVHLSEFVGQSGSVDARQVGAWESWVPTLQQQASQLLDARNEAKTYTAILEYQLPRDFRRPDVIVLENGIVVVLELKGGVPMTRAGLDQVLAYARDLRAYHSACHSRPVVPVLVPTFGPSVPVQQDGAWIVNPSGIHGLLAALAAKLAGAPLSTEQFLASDAYCPLPSIVQAARDLLEHGDIP